MLKYWQGRGIHIAFFRGVGRFLLYNKIRGEVAAVDEEIIRLMGDRDERGLELLKKRYGNMLRYIVTHIVSDPRDAEECISDVYLRVWERAALYDAEKGLFFGWLTAVTRNAALNRAKCEKPAPVGLSDDAEGDGSPEDALVERERTVWLRKVIADLYPEEQRLFYRKYYYLQTTAQIAAELGTTERAVEGRLYRIRRKLQIRLGGELE